MTSILKKMFLTTFMIVLSNCHITVNIPTFGIAAVAISSLMTVSNGEGLNGGFIEKKLISNDITEDSKIIDWESMEDNNTNENIEALKFFNSDHGRMLQTLNTTSANLGTNVSGAMNSFNTAANSITSSYNNIVTYASFAKKAYNCIMQANDINNLIKTTAATDTTPHEVGNTATIYASNSDNSCLTLLNENLFKIIVEFSSMKDKSSQIQRILQYLQGSAINLDATGVTYQVKSLNEFIKNALIVYNDQLSSYPTAAQHIKEIGTITVPAAAASSNPQSTYNQSPYNGVTQQNNYQQSANNYQPNNYQQTTYQQNGYPQINYQNGFQNPWNNYNNNGYNNYNYGMGFGGN